MAHKEWKLPYQPRMINDADPGHEGPVCLWCAEQYLDTLRRAEATPMLKDLRNREYRSPHYGTYMHELRVIQWACASGQHGPVKFFRY